MKLAAPSANGSVVHELRANAAGVIAPAVGFGVGERSGVGDGAGSGVQEASRTPRTPAPAPISSVRRVILIVSQRYRARVADACEDPSCTDSPAARSAPTPAGSSRSGLVRSRNTAILARRSQDGDMTMNEPQIWTLIAVFSATMLGVVTVMTTQFSRVIRAEICLLYTSPSPRD